MKFYLPLAIVILISGCRRDVKCFETFCIDEDFKEYETLIKEGFEKSEVDALMFERRINDTLVTYEFKDSGHQYESKYWAFYIQKEEGILKLQKFLERHHYYLMIPISYEEIMENQFFCVRNFDNNNIFFLKISSTNPTYFKVEILYYFNSKKS
jgi:hypothetical protein